MFPFLLARTSCWINLPVIWMPWCSCEVFFGVALLCIDGLQPSLLPNGVITDHQTSTAVFLGAYFYLVAEIMRCIGGLIWQKGVVALSNKKLPLWWKGNLILLLCLLYEMTSNISYSILIELGSFFWQWGMILYLLWIMKRTWWRWRVAACLRL